MPQAIQDEFTSLRVSRQRRYQLRHEKAKVCRLCPAPVAKGSKYCPTHLEHQREHCRRPAADDPRSLI